MGIFDLFKRKKPDQSPLKAEQEVEIHQNKAYMDFECVKDERENEVSLGKIPIDQNGRPILSDLLEIAVPSEQGLYPHEILMLEYAQSYKVSQNTFQSFWYWQYSVTEPQNVLNSLMERNFIEAEDLRSALERLTASEIKENLKLINQKVSGKKGELINRLLEFSDIGDLNEKYSERHYVLTLKGERELKDNQYVVYLHRNRYMSVWEMNLRIAKTHYPYRDVLWGYFNEQSGAHFQNYDFGLYRNIRMNMYRFLMEENKVKTAFHILCEVLAFDLSGLGNNCKIVFESEKNNLKLFLMICKSRVNSFFPYEKTTLIVPPVVVNEFTKIQAILGMDDREYKDVIVKALSEVHPPQRVFTDYECADIVMACISNNIEALAGIYGEAENREKERIRKIEKQME